MGLTLKDRTIIAKRWANGDSAAEIAKGLGFAPGTIYAELARGHTGQLSQCCVLAAGLAGFRAAYQGSFPQKQ